MLLPSHHRPMRLADVRQWSDFVCLFGLKLLGAQKNRLTAVNNLIPVLACYIGPKSAHVLSCFILNNFGPPSAHAFHWWLWWMDGRTDRQTDRQTVM